jgi:hypothetical protein
MDPTLQTIYDAILDGNQGAVAHLSISTFGGTRTRNRLIRGLAIRCLPDTIGSTGAY